LLPAPVAIFVRREFLVGKTFDPRDCTAGADRAALRARPPPASVLITQDR
jgi:hypothetical protein